MTGADVTQGMVATGEGFPLHTRGALSEPIPHIIGHTRPIEPVTQAGYGAVPAQMATK